MPPKPDLETHSLIRFLDRFVQRNPRKPATGLHGHSIFQPLAAVDSSAQLVSAKAKFGAVAPVSSQSTAWKMDTSGVDTLDVAFQQYFSIKNKGKESAKKKKEKKKEKKRADESDSEDEDENEDEIWKALVDSKPDIEGDEEEESDLDLGDLEEAMDEEEEDEDEDEGGIDLDAADEPAAAEEESDADSFAVFDEDDEDVFGSDEDLPSDLDDAFQKELEFADGKTIKDKGGREKASERKRRLKNLPTFASADDYAALLGDEEEEESYGG